MRYFAVLALILAGCNRSTVNMDVVSEQGSLRIQTIHREFVWGPGTLRTRPWEIGEQQFCRQVQYQFIAGPEGHREILICGTETNIAWDFLTEDEAKGGEAASVAEYMELQMTGDAKTFAVVFHGSTRPHWRCVRTAEGISCE
jgi:hypothetical protein